MDRLVIDMPTELGRGTTPENARQVTAQTSTDAESGTAVTSADVRRFVAWFDCWSDSPFSR